MNRANRAPVAVVESDTHERARLMRLLKGTLDPVGFSSLAGLERGMDLPDELFAALGCGRPATRAATRAAPA